jgi:tetratricopeptide (TPR) repeat protein
MKLGIAIAVLFGCELVAVQGFCAQAPPAQGRPSDAQKSPSNSQKPASQANPFPEDMTNVPVLPNGNSPAVSNAPSYAHMPSTLPAGDVDPVRSPDDPQPDSSTADAEGFSSSTTGLDRALQPPPDTDADRGKKGKGQPPPDHQETAAEDESVGAYYLNIKNWKGALSRFESAVVLDPENPEVYWGLGEAQRHLGKFADARASYEKLVEYDPDSKHAKEAKKILKDPELANAPTASSAKP